MPIRIVCPGCEAVYRLVDASVGRTLRCKQCQGAIRVEAPGGPAADPDASTRVATQPGRSAPPPPPAGRSSGRAEARPEGDDDDGAGRRAKPRKKSAAGAILLGCGAVAFLGLGGVGVAGYVIYQRMAAGARDLAGRLEKVKTEVEADRPKKPIAVPENPPDQTPYALKVRGFPGEGKAVRVRRTVQKKGNIQGKEGPVPVDELLTEVYTINVFESGDPSPVRLKEIYEKAEITGPEGRKLAYEGAEYDVTRQGDSATSRFTPLLPPGSRDGTPLSFRSGSSGWLPAFLPPGPVKVGETWTVANYRPFKSVFLPLTDELGQKVEGKLDRVEVRDGKTVAVVTFDMEFQVGRFGGMPADNRGPVTLAGKVEFDPSGSTTAWVLEMQGKVALRADRGAGAPTLTADLTLREERGDEIPIVPKTPAPEVKPEEWKEYVSAEGRFRAEYPGRPTLSLSSGPSQMGRFTTTVNGVGYQASWQKALAGKSGVSTLDILKKGLARGGETANITQDGQLGIEYTTTRSHNGKPFRVQERAVVVGDRLFRFAVEVPQDAVFPKEKAARFLGSVKFTR